MIIRKFLIKLVNLFPSLREYLIAIRDHKQAQIPISQTPFGFKMAGSPAMISGKFEIQETPLIRKLAQENSIFVNIGANVGYYCCFAAMDGKSVIAFEPHIVNGRILMRNMEINGFSDQAEIYPTAVGAQNGILKLFGSGTAASLVDGWAGTSSENFSLVPVVTLDGVLAGRFEDQSIFILIDVEGAELSVLQGALGTLNRKRKPWWLIEITVSEHQPAGTKVNPNLLATFDLLYSGGYEIWALSVQPRRIHRDEVVQISETEIDTIKIHNFLCVDSGAIQDALAALSNPEYLV